jgi:hypothetical protein
VTTGSPLPQVIAVWPRELGETDTATGPEPAAISTPDFAK